MSWFDDLVDLGSTAFTWFTGKTAGAALARTALTGYALNQVTQSINKEQKSDVQKQQDKGVRFQVNPDPNEKIPVVYGKAVLGGIVTDALLTNSNQTMYFCLTLCEQTGNLSLGSGAVSDILFKDIYWNNQRLIFESTGANAGYVVVSAVDASGTVNTNVSGLIQVFCYSGGSAYPVLPSGYTNATTYLAPNIVPNWTANHLMTDLVFAIVRIDYNKEKEVTGLGDMKFVLENTMSLPGDCLYDYATNTKYGAGIDPTEIYAS
jgi:hypothetical protein